MSGNSNLEPALKSANLSDMDETSQLAKVFENLGAPAGKARTMAGQLLRRAEQIATEKKISKVESLDRLIRLCVKGFHGEIDPNFVSTRKEFEKK